jgi:hypothetical protein
MEVAVHLMVVPTGWPDAALLVKVTVAPLARTGTDSIHKEARVS